MHMALVSLWQDLSPHVGSDSAVDTDRHCDVAVVGAGLTGLTTALLLARAGRSVVVLEGAWVGAGTTGRSTAKVSALQGTQLSRVAAHHGSEVVGSYVEAQREAVAWVEQFCDVHGVAVQHRDAVTYAHTANGERSVREELALATAHGLPAVWSDELPLPYPTRGGVRLADQLQLDPIQLLRALADQARAHGVSIVEDARVTKVRGSDPVQVTTDRGTVSADRVVVATNLPILDRAGFFARMKPARSYSLAFRTPHPAVDAMYLSADQPSRSLRDAPSDNGHVLMVGGNGHTTGRSQPTSRRLDQLRTWTMEHWPDAVETHAWSAQDYVPSHALPYAGPLLPGTEHVLAAGGYSKWGMTNGVAAALVLSGRLLGGHQEWSRAFTQWAPRDVRGLAGAARDNAEVALEMTKGWTTALLGRSVREAGVTRVCTHLGGIVTWNDAERSWDCPLHGSRFDEDGPVLEGPAVCGLRRKS
jgi:glycine/D-amino acid oxidase-like deaminating enzyme